MCRLQGAAQRRSGGQGMVAFASDPYTNSTYAVKFYFSTTSFQREKSAITHPALERAMPAWCAPPHQWLDRDFRYSGLSAGTLLAIHQVIRQICVATRDKGCSKGVQCSTAPAGLF